MNRSGVGLPVNGISAGISFALLPHDSTAGRWLREPEACPDQTPALRALWSPTCSLASGRMDVCCLPAAWPVVFRSSSRAGWAWRYEGRGRAGERQTLWEPHTFMENRAAEKVNGPRAPAESCWMGTGRAAPLGPGRAWPATRGRAPVYEHDCRLVASLGTRQQGPPVWSAARAG